MHYVTEAIAVGSLKEALNMPFLLEMGFRAVLACSSHMPPVVPQVLFGKLDVEYNLPWTEVQKARAVEFIQMGLKMGKVFVYSDFGLSRAPAAALFYLMSTGLSFEQAFDIIEEKIPDHRIQIEILSASYQEAISTPVVTTDVQEVMPSGLLSVVVVTFNRADTVRQALEALQKHTEVSYELFIVDNGSDSDTLSYLEALEVPHILVRCGRNLGKGKAANIGFSLCHGRWVCYLDSDIVVPKGWFFEIARAYRDMDKAGWLSLPYDTMLPGPVTDDLISGGMVFLSRERLAEAGGFPEDRLYGAIDLEYAKKVREKGYHVGFATSQKAISHIGTPDSAEYAAWKEAQRHTPTPPPLAGPTPPVEIVLVRFNMPQMEAACIESIHAHTRWPYVLTVVDNYQNKERLGSLWNRIIERSRCDYVCLLNTDTLVTEDWLPLLMDAFSKVPNAAVVGPSTNSCGTSQQIAQGLEPEKREEHSAHLRATKKGQMEATDLSGFCYLLKKEAWKNLNGFSGDFGFFGQDTDFNIRAGYAGYATIWRKDAFVYHSGGASSKKAQDAGQINIQQERDIAHLILQSLRRER